MRTVYALQFEIDQHELISTSDLFERLVAKLNNWIREKYERKWQTLVEVDWNSDPLTPHPGHRITANRRSVQESELITLDWSHPADNDPTLQWQTSCVFGKISDRIQVSFLVRISSIRLVLQPARFQVGRPKIVSQVLQEFACNSEGWTIPSAPINLSSPDVDRFVEDVLLNLQRNIPVVVISTGVWDGTSSVNENDVFNCVRGFAHVVKLEDKWAAFKLTDCVGRALSCFDGAVRIYWPGFALTDNPYGHKLFMREAIRQNESEGNHLDNYLFNLFSSVASFRFADGAVIRAVRQQLNEAEKQRLDTIRSTMQTGRVERDRLEMDLLESFEQIDKLRAECFRLQEELDAQIAAWDSYQSAVSEKDGDLSRLTEPESSFASVGEAVTEAKRTFSDVLVFLDSAVDSANDSPYQSPDRVYEFFEALHFIASEWREKDGVLGRSWGEAMVAMGFDLRDQISKTSKGKFGKEYTFVYKGKKRLFEQHVTLGAKQAHKCLSVHIWRDDDDKVVVIGHCGRHLSNTST